MANTQTREQTILCVDDNEAGLRIREALLRTFGFEVRLATSGAAALKMMESAHFDAVILDYHMPEMDGAELTDRIKRGYPQMPIVMLTGYAQDVPPRTLQLLDAIIVKGDATEKLLETLHRLTGTEFKRPPMSVHQITTRNADQFDAVSKYLKTQRQGRR